MEIGLTARRRGRPNVLIFPDLQSANAAYRLVWRLGGAEAIGPILLGMKKPVHVLPAERHRSVTGYRHLRRP